MLIRTLAHSLLAIPLLAQASDRAAMLEGCSALADLEKKARCFEAVARMPAEVASAAPPAQHQSAVRALETVLAATRAGVSWERYSVQIQEAGVQVELLRESADPTSRRVHLASLPVLAALKDAREWWERDIRFFSRRDNRIAYPNGLPVQAAGVEHLAATYGMTLGRSDILGLNAGLDLQSALAVIWTVAEDRFRAVRAVASGAAIEARAKTVPQLGPAWLGTELGPASGQSPLRAVVFLSRWVTIEVDAGARRRVESASGSAIAAPARLDGRDIPRGLGEGSRVIVYRDELGRARIAVDSRALAEPAVIGADDIQGDRDLRELVQALQAEPIAR